MRQTCGGCQGPYTFDTVVPSAIWNGVVRAKGMNEYLCLGCVVTAFAKAEVSFTATLIGPGFDFVPIEVLVRGQATKDVELVDKENTLLRSLLIEIEQGEPLPVSA